MLIQWYAMSCVYLSPLVFVLTLYHLILLGIRFRASQLDVTADDIAKVVGILGIMVCLAVSAWFSWLLFEDQVFAEGSFGSGLVLVYGTIILLPVYLFSELLILCGEKMMVSGAINRIRRLG